MWIFKKKLYRTTPGVVYSPSSRLTNYHNPPPKGVYPKTHESNCSQHQNHQMGRKKTRSSHRSSSVNNRSSRYMDVSNNYYGYSDNMLTENYGSDSLNNTDRKPAKTHKRSTAINQNLARTKRRESVIIPSITVPLRSSKRWNLLLWDFWRLIFLFWISEAKLSCREICERELFCCNFWRWIHFIV